MTPSMGVVHSGGATFAYEPIAGVSVYIIFGAMRTPRGVRYYRAQEMGPWGNSDPAAKDARGGFDQEKSAAEDLAWELLRAVDRDELSEVFGGKIIDQTT